MPLKQTPYGKECPLEKFKIDIAAGAGCYDNDPVEACLGCNFNDSNKSIESFENCACPPNITWSKYDELRKNYIALNQALNRAEGIDLTKKGFQDFVKNK